MDVDDPDLVQYANRFGAAGHLVESHHDVARILTTALDRNGVHVVDLPVDRSLNHSILNILLTESNCIV